MKILCESDSPTNNTGFSHVVRHLYHYFSKLGHDLFVSGWQDVGLPKLTCSKCEQDLVMLGKVIDPCRLYWSLPVGPLEMAQTYGKFTIPEYIFTHKPDLLFSLADVQWIDFYTIIKKTTPWLAYFPIDSLNWLEDWNPILDKIEYPITYSKTAQKVCEENGYGNVKMIYHGHNPEIFKPHPLPKVRESIDKNLHKVGFDPDSFIVGTVQTVNPRKNWDYWLQIFAEFAKDKDDAVAILVTDPNSPMAFNSQINLRRIIKKLKLHKKIWIPTNYHYWGGYNDLEIAEITNWMRQGCYFTVSGGEGFGLGQFQAMCCKVPVVAMDYTTPSEFLENGRGYLIKIGDYDNLDGIDRPLPDIDDAVSQLEEVYYHRNKAKKIAKKGYEWASKITWEATLFPHPKIRNPAIPTTWIDVLNEVQEDL